ncbi:MAG: preprotein translocase subunit YajC [Gaiellaceae bacterium]|nr:preprotein translocase subunit YajC [Gaiellaceae bacterium]MDX6518093.1 preprotein translocase subunit YajC [Gaiellaceae bacterium]
MFLYLFVLLPQRRATRAKMEMQDSIDVGDEIVTAGGMYGYVTSIGDDELEVEIAPGTVVRVATRAVAARIDPDVDEDEPDEEEDAEEPAATSAEPTPS